MATAEVIDFTVRPITPKELHQMSTATASATVPTQSAAKAANGHQMHALIQENAVAASLGDRIAALPQKAAETLRGALGVFRLDAAANGASAALARLRQMAGGLLGKVGSLGWGTIAGVILTAGRIRRTAVSWLGTAYKIVTLPIRWVASGIGWLLRKVGLGKAADWVQAKVTLAERWVAGKIEGGLRWMDSNENHGAMRWGRAVFQATFIQRALALVFPWASGAWVFMASLFFAPSFGVASAEAIASEEAAIKRAADKLRSAGERAASAAGQAATAAAALPTAKVAPEAKAAAANGLVDGKVTDELARDKNSGVLYPVHRVTLPDSSKWIKIGETMYAEDEVPDSFEFGQVVGTATEAEVAAAQGPAPKLHGPANRQAKRQR